MASYHCTVKAGGKGRAGPHADYIEREGKYAPEQAQGKSKLEDLAHKASGNMPAWAEHDAGIFWRAADEHERANGATYREIEVALPRELTPEQRIALVEDFINQQIGKGHAFTFAIHIPKAAIEKGDQPHAHIMYSERTLDGIDRDPEQYFKRASTKNPEKGGCKKDSAGTKERLLATRELWAKVQNAHLEKAGCEDRVSHLSLKAQGIDRQPEKHLGPIDAKKINAPALVESRSAERELVQARKELLTIDVTAELAAQHAAAREAQGAIAKAAAAQVQAQQARAQAQAAHDLATAIKAKEKEDDDRIRDAAIAALAKSSAATDRHIEAAGRTSDSNRGDLESAAKGAERREFGKHLEVSAPAVAKQLGNVGHVLQQLVEHFPNLVRSIAAAVQAVAQQVAKRLAKAPEQPKQAAPAKAITPPEQPPTAAQHPEIDCIAFQNAADKALAERTKALYVCTTPPGEAQRQQLAIDIQAAISDAVATSRATEPKLNPALIEREIKADQNREAARTGKMEPWPPGQSNCALHVPAANAKRALDAHLEMSRPMMIGKKAYDDKTAALASNHKSTVDAAKAAEVSLACEVTERTAQVARQDTQSAPKHAAAEQRIASLTALQKIVDRERRAANARDMQKIAPKEKGKARQPPERTRSRGGYER